MDEVQRFLDGVPSAVRRRDAHTLVDLMRRVTGEEPVLYGSIVGFGNYHYKYPSGREGDAPAAAFAPRKANTVVYLTDGIGAHTSKLEGLGPHKVGVGCLYLTDLAKIDLDVLESVVADAYRTLTAETFGKRARDGREE